MFWMPISRSRFMPMFSAALVDTPQGPASHGVATVMPSVGETTTRSFASASACSASAPHSVA